MQPKLAEYRNDKEQAITVRIGERPGEPPIVYTAEPGKTVQGPANYREKFHREGLTFVKELPREKAPATEAEDPFGLLRETRAAVARMQQETEALRRENATLKADNAELRGRLGAAETRIADLTKPAEKAADPSEKPAKSK